MFSCIPFESEPNAGTENDKVEEGKAICRGENNGEDSSKRAESYVLQFVCVEKVAKETPDSSLPWTSSS